MLNEKNIKNLIVLIAIAFLAYSCMPRDARPRDEVQDDTNRAMESVRNQQQSVSCEIELVGNELTGIREANERIAASLDSMQERLDNQSSEIERCRKLIGECRNIAEDSASIFQEIGRPR